MVWPSPIWIYHSTPSNFELSHVDLVDHILVGALNSTLFWANPTNLDQGGYRAQRWFHESWRVAVQVIELDACFVQLMYLKPTVDFVSSLRESIWFEQFGWFRSTIHNNNYQEIAKLFQANLHFFPDPSCLGHAFFTINQGILQRSFPKNLHIYIYTHTHIHDTLSACFYDPGLSENRPPQNPAVWNWGIGLRQLESLFLCSPGLADAVLGGILWGYTTFLWFPFDLSGFYKDPLNVLLKGFVDASAECNKLH